MKTLLLLCALLCGALNAAEIFVAASGNDAAAGSKAAPLASLAKAVEKAAAGDSILLREGTYSGGVTVGKADVTVAAFESEKVSIKAANDVERVGNCLWFTANNGIVRGIDLVGGFY